MIKFENVSVTYPGGVEALKDLNLKIKVGDKVKGGLSIIA
jgi:ABC-type ATPase involved in cell division